MYEWIFSKKVDLAWTVGVCFIAYYLMSNGIMLLCDGFFVAV